jgi:hypothetical protein
LCSPALKAELSWLDALFGVLHPFPFPFFLAHTDVNLAVLAAHRYQLKLGLGEDMVGMPYQPVEGPVLREKLNKKEKDSGNGKEKVKPAKGRSKQQ